MYLSLVASQGGGIHSEEEFDLWIRVNGLFSPRQMIGNFVLAFNNNRSVNRTLSENEVDPLNTSKKQKAAVTPGNGT